MEHFYEISVNVCLSAQRVAILTQKLEFLSKHQCVNQSQLEELVKVRRSSAPGTAPKAGGAFSLVCSKELLLVLELDPVNIPGLYLHKLVAMFT